QLANLRGAAMKMGQMISMDAGDMLPAELADILARLRDNAQHMPPQQLNKVLVAEWDKGWRTRFQRFEPRAMAAASIGQVHRAIAKDGRPLAVKVQYPGVRESIDADVDNVTTLLRVSGLLPRELDMAPLLAEAKRQLHQEADYRREAREMARFAELLAGDDRYVVPLPADDFTTDRVLAMDFIDGAPIEVLATAPQAERDRVMTVLIDLVLKELFTFGQMQTDPNFANYRYQSDGGALVLLDFGAARPVAVEVQAAYRKVVAALFAGERDALRAAATEAGFVGPAAAARHGGLIDKMIDIVLAEFEKDGPFDFGDRAFVAALREDGMTIAEDRTAWHIPPVETLFVQRKISGTALLAARLKAKVDVRELAAAALS
ncbi:MAG: AarF/ABC1/UbiB kinase family protein, partial [Pseudomonadota bacterium]